MKYTYSFASVITCFFLASCMLGPNYKRPALSLPQNYTETQVSDVRKHRAQSHIDPQQALPASWWKLFRSKKLNRLVSDSLKHNPNVDALKANLQTSLESVYAQRGALYPYVGLFFNPSKQQVAKILTSVLASNDYIYSLYTAQVFVTYTPDVFGATRRQIESLVAQAQVQRFQLEALYITLASNVATAAIQEGALREQIALTKQLILSQKKMVGILTQQIQLGNASITDFNVQQALLAQYESNLAPLEQNLSTQHHLIKALVGKYPDDPGVPKFRLSDLSLPHTLPLSLPASLLEHRPDIRAAEANMQSANALIGVAIANRLPNISIGFTSAGTAARNFSTFLQRDTNFWSLAGLITQPIFDAGTLKHQQRAAVATYQRTAAQYKSTVINAFQNVADTLHALQADKEALKAAEKAAAATLSNLHIAKQQYANGSINTLSLLSNEQAYYLAKTNLIQANANRLSDTVALFQALGGGWWQASKQ